MAVEREPARCGRLMHTRLHLAPADFGICDGARIHLAYRTVERLPARSGRLTRTRPHPANFGIRDGARIHFRTGRSVGRAGGRHRAGQPTQKL